jgi:3'-phosphoadenosine 5'-phosphosulfate sulfotransferase (PAPS reductase)/FAD synthetase
MSMKDLFEKIEFAKKFIAQVLETYHLPVIMSSFGKDSMVMLDLVDNGDLPILFHREPFEPLKYAFANKIIAERRYAVYDYAPNSTEIVKNGSAMEIINKYQVGPKSVVWLGTGIKEPDPAKPFLCGYRDLYMKPLGTFNYPWDVAFVGHKSSDHDPILGAIPLTVDIKANEGSCDFAYPLRHFTDAEIWEYIETFNVPYNERRYDKANAYREFPDVTYNNDYYHTCVKCMDRDEAAAVFCPRLGCDISNISGSLRYVEPTVLNYGVKR